MTIDQLSALLATLLKDTDELSRIEKEVHIGILLKNAYEKGYLDAGVFVDLTLTGVNFLDYLKKFKSISSDEAKALIKYRYVTFDDMVRVLVFGIGQHK